jgi:flagellin-like hook-associated protein FlgL
MSNEVVLTGAIRQNLLTLQKTTELQGKFQERLSSGRKVNSAIDNPTNFFTAAGLTRRSNDLGLLLDGMSQGVKTLEAADNAMKMIVKTVETMQANVRQTRQDKSFKGVTYVQESAGIGTAASSYLTFSGGGVGVTPVNVPLNIADIGGSRTTAQTTLAYAPPTTAQKASLTGTVALNAGVFAQQVDVRISFAGINADVTLANGSNRSAALAQIQAAIANSGLNGRVTATLDASNFLRLETVNPEDGAITVTDNGTAGSATELVGAAPASVTGSNGQTNFTVNGTPVALTTSETNVSLAVAKANADLGPGHPFEAYANGANLQFRAKSHGASALAIAGADSALFAAPTIGTAPTTPGTVRTVDQMVTAINTDPALTGKIRAHNDGGKLRIENLSVEPLTMVGATSTQITGGVGATNTQTIAGNEVRKSLIEQFNELRRQLDKLADDASYNGVNLLKADKLKITFNEINTSAIEIQAKDTNGTVRAINTGPDSLDIGEATSDEFSTDALLDARYDALGAALTELQTQSAQFGSGLTMVQIREEFTKTMINTLEIGADKLTLADANEEGANLLALNTRQQLSQTALSLAAQAQQAVLRLFV